MGPGWWIFMVAAWILVFPTGIAAVSTGWMLPWLRKRTVSPRLWGWGDIILGVGLTILTFIMAKKLGSGAATAVG